MCSEKAKKKPEATSHGSVNEEQSSGSPQDTFLEDACSANGGMYEESSRSSWYAGPMT